MNGERADKDAGFFLGQIGPFEVGFRRDLFAIPGDLRSAIVRRQSIDQRMLRREHHVVGAVKRVVPRGKNADVVAGIGDPGDLELDLSAFAATDPVSLQRFE